MFLLFKYLIAVTSITGGSRPQPIKRLFFTSRSGMLREVNLALEITTRSGSPHVRDHHMFGITTCSGSPRVRDYHACGITTRAGLPRARDRHALGITMRGSPLGVESARWCGESPRQGDDRARWRGRAISGETRRRSRSARDQKRFGPARLSDGRALGVRRR